MARELVGTPHRPAGARSGPKNGTATQPSGSKLPRHSGRGHLTKECDFPLPTLTCLDVLRG
ncbi:hypothetical protein C1Y08_09365 [Pseudomonas sp. FW306-02-F02-AA]|nr:hypothetical protein C1Y07_09220 [Pseudomonas sp. FW306-02-F02-AB]PMZ08787.1 hypothetical protein C1Y06_17940 [Pseudomonas sp. FW306-02-H06C]PMZ16216.1 hypothetical protein C1Y08_09365 [Pseudomonas sp. FW306-02-F02-AA]PMZ22157.1 hypothetical protein C1Y09_09910 [Pseudomonas sp. FW306-02-F08-AA]PMZ27375.1 hypothetical protein C1Y05_13415 [Pseudomonas sp. FW306-02-F04-BA]PMZ34871.1 hypothetical protein C1X99_09150 [Pseudomonas sp. FW306-02-H06B]PMZ40575.1 hypothetical protein C1Y00_11070 [Ps